MPLSRVIENVCREVQKALERQLVHPKAMPERHQAYTIARLFRWLDVASVFDVGANGGQYATMLRRRARYRGTIISFEPLPEMAELLRGRATGDANWRIDESAIDQTDGEATFHVMKDRVFSSLNRPASADTALYADRNAVEATITVRNQRLATALATHSAKGAMFLKLDTQGHDYRILEANAEAMQRFCAFQTEMPVQKLYAGSADSIATLKLADELGFALAGIHPVGHTFPQLVEVDGLFVRRDALRFDASRA